jgi:hypothetical protein
VASMTEAAFAPAWDPEACADLAIWPWQSVVPPKTVVRWDRNNGSTCLIHVAAAPTGGRRPQTHG